MFSVYLRDGQSHLTLEWSGFASREKAYAFLLEWEAKLVVRTFRTWQVLEVTPAPENGDPITQGATPSGQTGQ
jgi:hypothetical protein